MYEKFDDFSQEKFPKILFICCIKSWEIIIIAFRRIFQNFFIYGYYPLGRVLPAGPNPEMGRKKSFEKTYETSKINNFKEFPNIIFFILRFSRFLKIHRKSS